MSRKRQLVNAITKVIKQFTSNVVSRTKKQIIWLLRTVFTTRRKHGLVNAGFVLPTVAMVALVVVLLTTAILFRSFERAKNASNVRVNEIVLRAAAPALDRAKAKLDKLFQDPRLPRSTPSDFSLSQVLEGNITEYTFGDEISLKLVKDFNGTTGIQEDEEAIKSAWKYPVDTDNDGKFDSFTLYGIYFRTPTSTRPRSALEARAQPMDEGATTSRCASNVATSADLVGSQGWYKVGSKLKRSLFVYTTTVPITDLTGIDNTGHKYQKFTGNKGFSSLEYQQDRERLPLTNNAVIYENDLEIAPGAGLNINGRIFTNSNLLTKFNDRYGGIIRYFLVSSPYSCYYAQENSKIIVAGNVINSRVDESSSTGSDNGVRVDLFRDNPSSNFSPTATYINNNHKTVPSSIYGNNAAYNDDAYAQRIARLVGATNALYPATNPPDSSLPDEVKEGIKNAMANDATLTPLNAQNQQLRTYFKKRTRRVPYQEVGVGKNALKQPTDTGATYDYTSTSPFATGSYPGNSLRPVDEWVFPFDPSDGKTATNFAKIGINNNGSDKIYLPATDPATAKGQTPIEEKLMGDRLLVGNNLPELWYNGSRFVTSDTGQTISGKEWDKKWNGDNTTNPRQRFSQANFLSDLGVTDRDGFWEKAATQKPTGPLDVVGGLRVVTGAGIYLPDNRTPSSTTAQLITADLAVTDKVWPDSMPMGVTTNEAGLPYAATPYLKMRATAVYHYQDYPYDPNAPATYQTPIACVATYYDPTTSTTAKNRTQDFAATPNALTSLTGISTVDPDSPANTNNKSLNGIVYSASSLSTSGYTAALNYQAALKYPNGRWVNQPLKDALANAGNLTLSQQSAVDSAMCALKILDGTIGAPTNTKVPHGAIREITFLDARQIKAIDKVTGSTNYDLDVELRQPLEIRATVLDMDLLRKKAKTDGEFLFPNSGIIYATRDDALPDLSSTNTPNQTTNREVNLDLSSKDFKLDPTRRPNGIMLINGSDLSRNDTYKAEEKGLILASNLPVYVKGDFNKHTKEEFTENLDTDGDANGISWKTFYTRHTLDPNFACRKNQFGNCTTGETWRPATVLADAITVVSGDFKEGYRNNGDYNLSDNYGNYPLGYDFNGGGISSATTVSLNEQKDIQFDLNGDGSITDTTVSTVDETVIKADMNGDGDMADTSVALNESNISATVAARLNGFWDNNFVTSRDFTDSNYSTGTGGPSSSYFNNFVTPIQRRVQFSEYVMEICPKLTVTACTPGDWVVGYDGDGTAGFSAADKAIKANQLLQAITDAGVTFDKNKLWAGTTAQPAATQEAQQYPRRVAFLRYGNGLTVTKNGTTLNASPVENALVLDSDKTPVPLGIVSGAVKYLPFSNTLTINTLPYDIFDKDTNNYPDRSSNALWFRTRNRNGNAENYSYDYRLDFLNTLTGTRATEQPLLVPVLQIQYPRNSTIDPADMRGSRGTPSDLIDRSRTNWFQNARATETNLVFAQGDSPSRPNESGGGLENFVRYLERWDINQDSYGINHKATGSFIEFKRSSYASAPFQALINSSGTETSIFRYPQSYTSSVSFSGGVGSVPFYSPPNRLWGYDVALLTQLPDLFSQRFTAPTLNAPNEFYREVPRDDTWVKTLLCAAQADTTGGYTLNSGDSTKYGTNYKYAVSSDQRPSCP